MVWCELQQHSVRALRCMIARMLLGKASAISLRDWPIGRIGQLDRVQGPVGMR